MIDANLYLGYGPIGTGGLNSPPAIENSESSVNQRLTIMFPTDPENTLGQQLHKAMQLAAWFGTLGSRSRNGWGALQLEQEHLQPLTKATLESLGVTRSLQECLRLDWPHAIGKDDEGPLVWKTKVTGNWRQVMKELARIKIAFRTQPALSLHGVPNGQFAKRHFLAYPVTHHIVNGQHWGNQARVANQLRFKVAETSNGQLTGIIVHLPCAIPRKMAETIGNAASEQAANRAWQAVHQVLDSEAQRLQ